MARYITVGAAQMGPVGRDESRAAVVDRLLELMREAKGRGCDLVVFTECALTPFFPRKWEDDLNACDRWFERDMPGPETHRLFDEAKALGIGFHLGYAELAEENSRFQHYNSSILVGRDGQILGKYRKIHLPGQNEQNGENPHHSYEKRYFDVGNLGFQAWRAFGGVVGMCLGNDRRWPETYRVLGLQGAELIVLGYNTVADHPDHPELDHLTNFHSMLSMQAGAYQNGCYVVGVAKAGNEEGFNQIGRSAIISPSGEVVTQCTTLGDELVVHRCNLDQTRLYKNHIFNFAASRQIEAYSLITETRGAVPPQEPLSAEEEPASTIVEAEPAGSIQKLFMDEYGYSPEQADDLARQAELARGVAEPQQETAAPAEPKPAKTVAPTKRRRETSTDSLQAIREVFEEDYKYPAEKIEPLVQQAARALELDQSRKTDTDAETTSTKKSPPQKKAAASDVLAKARAEAAPPQPEAKPEPAKPDTEEVLPMVLPIAEDIGWLPGRFPKTSEESPDRTAAVVDRLMQDYRYSEETARQIAEFAETAWNRLHEAEEATKEEPPPTAVYVPEEHPEIEPAAENPRKPITTHAGDLSSSQTVPALSGEEAFQVFSVFTEKYGYHSRTARGIAERAYSAMQRWQKAQPAEAESAKAPEKESPKTQPAAPTTAPEKPPAAEVSEAAEAPVPEPAAPEPEPAQPEFVVVPCPECDFQLKINQEHFGLLGRKARCPNCQTKFRLPESV